MRIGVGRGRPLAAISEVKDFTAQEFEGVGAGALRELGRARSVRPKEVDHAVFGNAQQTSGDALRKGRGTWDCAAGLRLRFGG